MSRTMTRQLIALVSPILFISCRGGEPGARERWDPDQYVVRVPRLETPPRIDGDLSEWKSFAFTDGLWDLARVRHGPWFDPAINRLTDHGGEPSPVDDVRARYYLAGDETYLYLGAEVHDNINDTKDPQHEPKRWYFKDAVS